METIELIVLTFYLFFVIGIVFFNWLYSARAIRANRHIKLYTPYYIKRLVKISTGIALGTAGLILVYFVAKLIRLV